MDFANPTQADIAAFYAVMERLRGQTIHVHCIANYRVSALIYRYHVDVLGWNRADARRDLDAIWAPHGAWAGVVDGEG